MKYVYRIGVFILFALIIYSLFLPQYETLTDGMLDDTFSYMSQYPNPDQSGGFFGGGYYSTFNGFGSINALLSVILSLIVSILSQLPNLTTKTLRIPLIVLISLFGLTLLEIIMAPYMLSEPDKLLSGFYVLRLSEIGIFILAYATAKKNGARMHSNPDLLDN